MELRKIILARVIRLFTTVGDPLYMPDFINQVVARYGFVTPPEPKDIFGEERKAEFVHGRLMFGGQTIVVGSLTIYNDGLVVDTSTSTAKASVFADDVLGWLREQFPLLIENAKPMYLSQLEVKFDLLPEKYAEKFTSIAAKISEHLTSYGLAAQPFYFQSLNLAADPIGWVGVKPSPFGIERRSEVPYAENVFFAQAPLQTDHHIELLRMLEEAIASV